LLVDFGPLERNIPLGELVERLCHARIDLDPDVAISTDAQEGRYLSDVFTVCPIQDDGYFVLLWVSPMAVTLISSRDRF